MVAGDDGWTVVKLSRNRRANRRVVRTSTAAAAAAVVKDGDSTMMSREEVEYWLKRVEECVMDIKGSELWYNIMDDMKSPKVEIIECYGIGSIHRSIPSLYQFALVVAMKRQWSIDEVTITDPCMDDGDNKISHAFGFTTTTSTTQHQDSKTSSPPDDLPPPTRPRSTLLFMPHCDRSLYVSTLRHHCHVLSSTILIGNSFESYVLATPDGYTKLEGLVTEVPLRDATSSSSSSSSSSSPCLSAFNDLSIITFPSHNIHTIINEVLNSTPSASIPP
ncbi:hypothetical protein FOL46_003465 [Perkinsus olseni]|uniref:SRR1-like domain-containing protein n=1 Tax=Perkinsus olseni TaxID=32597 RepID=A0A7J6M2K0_PEROL|nr:hypothetical protein FOL46_003465 [Perkinsus olseni]